MFVSSRPNSLYARNPSVIWLSNYQISNAICRFFCIWLHKRFLQLKGGYLFEIKVCTFSYLDTSNTSKIWLNNLKSLEVRYMSCMLCVMEISFAEERWLNCTLKGTYELEVLDIRVVLKRKENSVNSANSWNLKHELGPI